MGADFSRIRFNSLLDYAGVELEQGRVLLDGDMNELNAILDRRLRALSSDVLGRSRVSSTTVDAFKISVAPGTLLIGKGRLYVDGLLAENHGAKSDVAAKRLFDNLLDERQFADLIRYDQQPYLPVAPALPTAGRHLVYLDVWKREVTYLEQPDLIESAVGVDATARVQTVWQVRVLANDAGAATTCESADADVPGWIALIAPSSGVLTTGTFDVAATDDPCELPPTGGYRGLENQLYRVEIHNPGQPGGAATFKWSRENASVGSRVASIVSATELELQTLGRDDVLRFNSGDWVEITDDRREFSPAPGELAPGRGEIRRITVTDATRRITFTPALPADMLPATFPDTAQAKTRNMRVRRWDQGKPLFRTGPGGTAVAVSDADAGVTTGLIKVPAAGTTLILENGVTVSFAATGAPGFRTGDYWVFAARTADASVELLDHAPPRGIHHHFERLGIWDVAAGTVTDCRHPWPPDVEGHDCSCTACVTADSHASGKFTIQDAVNQVRETGGTVCLGPGQYAVAEPVRLIGARSVRVRGQGPATILAGGGGIFALQDCLGVAIENLSIISLGKQAAVSVRTAIGLILRQLAIAVVGEDAQGSAVALQGVVAAATIDESAFFAKTGIMANDPAAVPPFDEDAGEPFLLAAALTIEHNVLLCAGQAVALNGSVLHVLGTRIARNEVLDCGDVAVSVLGLAGPPAALTIADNMFTIAGNGIRCGVGGAWIEGNKLMRLTLARREGDDTIGIAVGGGFDKSGIGQCQILSNQVSGFAMAAIEIAVPVRELLVKLNIIENCGNGIIVAAGSDGSSVAIENNILRDIRAAQDTEQEMVGIALVRADAATIAGNVVRGLGLTAQKSILRAGIFTLGVLRPRVSGNEVAELGPPGEFLGTSAGIMLRAPFAGFDVAHNHVQRDATAQAGTQIGKWQALVIAGLERDKASTMGRFASVAVDKGRVLVLARAHAALWAPAGDGKSPAGGSVLGNAFKSRGNATTVQIAADECQFSDNRVERDGDAITVDLDSLVAIVHANRVLDGGGISIRISAKKAAVLGNITTGNIAGFVPPGPTAGQPTATWDNLNIRA